MASPGRAFQVLGVDWLSDGIQIDIYTAPELGIRQRCHLYPDGRRLVSSVVMGHETLGPIETKIPGFDQLREPLRVFGMGIGDIFENPAPAFTVPRRDIPEADWERVVPTNVFDGVQSSDIRLVPPDGPSPPVGHFDTRERHRMDAGTPFIVVDFVETASR